MKITLENKDSFDVSAHLSNEIYRRIKEGGETQEDYEIILSKIADTRLEKCKKYGTSRYKEENGRAFDFWMCFSDIHRKYIRFKQLNELAIDGDDDAIKSLIDCYLDLANYGIMGFQILNKYQENKK